MAPRPNATAVRNRRAAASGAAPVRRPARLPSRNPFLVLLDDVRRDVDARLAGLLDAKMAEARRHGADVHAMADAIRDLTMRGGKRFRPALLVAAYRAVDENAPDEP